MLIDWFTVGAQVLNFIVLVWLLKHFLYKPILAAVDAREKKVASTLADADAKKAEAKKERDEFEHKNELFDKQRADLLSKATDAANTERQKLLDEARKAADAETAKRHATMISDAKNLSQSISRRTQAEVFSISRKVLADLATTELEASLTDVFIHKLAAMDGDAKARFGKWLKTASAAAVVRSAFALPASQQAAIQKAVEATFSAKVEVKFETAPELIGGIELTTTGEKISWSISDYLKSLEKGVTDLLAAKDSTAVPAKADNKPAAAGKRASAQVKPKSTGAKSATTKSPKPKPSRPKPEAKHA